MVTTFRQLEFTHVSEIDALCDLKPVFSFPGASVSPFVKQENQMLKNVYGPSFKTKTQKTGGPPARAYVP